MIGKLLGHQQVRTTVRYAHVNDNSVMIAAARIAASIADDINARPPSIAEPLGDVSNLHSAYNSNDQRTQLNGIGFPKGTPIMECP